MGQNIYDLFAKVKYNENKEKYQHLSNEQIYNAGFWDAVQEVTKLWSNKVAALEKLCQQILDLKKE